MKEEARRDYFAMSIVEGFMANPNISPVTFLLDDTKVQEGLAARAYRFADIMLATRKIPNE